MKSVIFDCIERLEHHKKTKHTKTTMVIKNNNDSKEDIIYFFGNCIKWRIVENTIEFDVSASKNTITQFYNMREKQINSNMAQLKRLIKRNKEDEKELLDYLKKKELTWIIEKIQN